MREGHKFFCFVVNLIGITPAYAGRTFHQLFFAYSRQDHPRLCGKDSVLNSELPPLLGSPPLMREGHSWGYVQFLNRGITPAYAGRTISNFFKVAFYRDHPRLCGKDRSYISPVNSVLGSPPLMREGLRDGRFSRLFFRITPAYAGRTNMFFFYFTSF